jgi:tetratricopeptide (TPR) repeat protein
MSRLKVAILQGAVAAAAVMALVGCSGGVDLTNADTAAATLGRPADATGDSRIVGMALREPKTAEESHTANALGSPRQLAVFGQPGPGMAAAGNDDPGSTVEAGRLVRAGRMAEADAIYLAVLARLPGSVEALNGHGVVLAQRGELTQAAVAFHQALQMRPDDVPARNNLDLVMMLIAQSRSAVSTVSVSKRKRRVRRSARS